MKAGRARHDSSGALAAAAVAVLRTEWKVERKFFFNKRFFDFGRIEFFRLIF